MAKKKYKQGQKVQVVDPSNPGRPYNAEVFGYNEKTDLVTLNLPRARRQNGTMQVTSDFVFTRKTKKEKG